MYRYIDTTFFLKPFQIVDLFLGKTDFNGILVFKPDLTNDGILTT